MTVAVRVRNFPVINDNVIAFGENVDRENRTWKDLDNWLVRNGSSLRQFYLATVGLTPANEMTAKLIELATAGAPRPSKSAEWDTWVGDSVNAYRLRQFFYRLVSERNRKASQYYDAELTALFKSLRPDWFLDQVGEKKDRIRAMAADPTCSRPSGELKNCFLNYCVRTGGQGYDQAFSDELRALRPDWFTPSVVIKKRELLAAAQAGLDKPSFQTDKRRAAMFRLYVTPGSKVYDEEFTTQMAALRPDWVFNVTQRQVDKLFELATAGAPRPLTNHKDIHCEESLLARALIQLTRRDRVNQSIGNKLRKLAPRWFDDSFVGAEKRRRQMLMQRIEGENEVRGA